LPLLKLQPWYILLFHGNASYANAPLTEDAENSGFSISGFRRETD